MKIHVEGLFLKQNDFSLLIKKWSVPANSHLLIEGSSGSGKTSFLHLLAGLLRPSSGSIQMGDQKITDLSIEELCKFRRSHVGMIFQKIHLLPHLTLLENVFLGAKNSEQRSDFHHCLAHRRVSLHHRSLCGRHQQRRQHFHGSGAGGESGRHHDGSDVLS